MRVCNSVRSELLLHSQGTADVVVDVTTEPETIKELRQKVTEKLGEVYGRMSIVGSRRASFKWFRKNEKYRFDVLVPDEAASAEFAPKDLRTAANKEKSIFYDARYQQGGISRPPFRMSNPASLMHYFNLDYLYEGCLPPRKSLPDVLEDCVKKGFPYTISSDTVREVPCLRINFDVPPKEYSPGAKRRDRFIVWVAPQMAFSVIKRCDGAKIVAENETELGDLTTFNAYRIYEGQYAESATHPGVWLLTQVDMIEKDRMTEKMSATLKDVQIGVDVADSMFTFAGMGASEGTVIYDVRVPKEPLKLVYGKDSVEELDGPRK